MKEVPSAQHISVKTVETILRVSSNSLTPKQRIRSTVQMTTPAATAEFKVPEKVAKLQTEYGGEIWKERMCSQRPRRFVGAV